MDEASSSWSSSLSFLFVTTTFAVAVYALSKYTNTNKGTTDAVDLAVTVARDSVRAKIVEYPSLADTLLDDANAPTSDSERKAIANRCRDIFGRYVSYADKPENASQIGTTASSKW